MAIAPPTTASTDEEAMILDIVRGLVPRSRSLASYGQADAAVLAAAYAHGSARNHGFADGNKRTAWVLARLFLADNGFELRFDPGEAIRSIEALASGTLAEDELAEWFRRRVTPAKLS